LPKPSESPSTAATWEDSAEAADPLTRGLNGDRSAKEAVQQAGLDQ